MLAPQPLPSGRDLLGLALRFFGLAVATGLLRAVFPPLNGSFVSAFMIDWILILSFYPLAAGLGFRPDRLGEYLRSLKTELRPAFRYFLLAEAVTIGGSYAWDMALAAWNTPAADKLLFWNSASSNQLTADPYVTGLLASPAALAWYLLSICVLAPLAEELLFRRCIYAGLRRLLPAWASVLAVGAFFGVFHGRDFAATAPVGVVLCLAYERTGRLQTPILVHAFSNALALAEIFGGRLW